MIGALFANHFACAKLVLAQPLATLPTSKDTAAPAFSLLSVLQYVCMCVYLQSATRELIDTSFRKLRSAEGACELLQNFKHIKSKGAIQKQVINKFNDILEQVGGARAFGSCFSWILLVEGGSRWKA